MDFQVTPIENTQLVVPPTGDNKSQNIINRIKSFFNLNKFKIIAGLILIGIIVGLLFYFFGRSSFSESQIIFAIEGPREIASGELVSYKLNYQNNSQTDLKDVKLSFFYSVDAVSVKDGNLNNVTNENIVLGDLNHGQGEEKIFNAYVIGDKGNIKTVKAILTFQPIGIRSVLKKEISLASTITSLPIPVNLVAPPNVISGQNLVYIIDYRNQSQQDFNDLRIKLKYPYGFKFSSATPSPSDGQSVWDVSRLKQGTGSRITIQGNLNGNQAEAKIVALTLQKKITTPAGDTYVDFEKTEATSIVSSPYLSVAVSVNDSINYITHLSDNLNYVINFKNNSSVDVSALTLSAKLEGGMFDLSSVQSDAFFDSRNNTITWNPSIIPALSFLHPGQAGTAKFSVRIKNNFTGNIGSSNALVKVSGHIETPNIPPELDIDNLDANDQLITRISSAPTFDQRIVRNDEQFGANGPYPLKVDNKTIFTVRWILVNPATDISPAKITAVLAPGVSWENRVRVNGNQPPPNFDSKLSVVSWDLDTLPAGTGTNFPKYEGVFQISVTPSVNQVGQAPPLLKNIRFDGVDVLTKEKISRTIQDSNTFNIVDSSETGTVQP